MQIKWILTLITCFSITYGAKIKDISSILGVRENELTGYGLVIGLNGTGAEITVAKGSNEVTITFEPEEDNTIENVEIGNLK